MRQVAPCRGVDTPAVSLFRARAAPNIWYLTCQLCYLGFGWRRQLCSAQNPGLSELLALEWAGESLYIEAVPLVLRPFLATDTRSPAHHHERAPFGVCGLLALPIDSPDLWGRPCRLSALARRVGVGYLLLRHACCGLATSGNAGRDPSRTVPWGTQWGQLE